LNLSAKSFALFKRDVFLFVTNLITSVVVARTLGPSALGLWVILQMILGYAESFGRMKWDIAAVYFLGKKKHEIGDVVFTLNALAIITSLLIIALVLWRFEWLYQVLFAKSEADVRVFMYVILPQIPLQFLSLNYSYLYIFREDVKTYNRIVIIKSLTSSIVGITLLVVFKLGLLGLVVSSLLSVLLGLLYGVARFGRTGKIRTVINVPLIKDLFSYGFILYLTGIVAQLNAYVTRLIVVFYLPTAQVAYFAMAQNQGQLLNKVPDALNVLLYPRISKMECNDDSARLAARSFRVVLVILLALGCAAFVVIAPVVELLYGRAFLVMVVPFRIILPGLVLSGAATVIGQYFPGIGRADISAKIAIAPLVIQITGGVLLIPTMGLIGAALAFLFSLVSLALIQVFMFLRISTCTARTDLVVRKNDVQVVATFVISEMRKVFSDIATSRRC